MTSLLNYMDLFNGKAVKAKSNGSVPVYGSNGKIGFTDKAIYSDAIVLGRVGAYCGSVQKEEKEFWASDNTIVVKNNEKSDLQFLYYYLINLNLNQFAGGAAQPLITHSLLNSFKVNLPALPEQKKIASFISVYDKLIQNNEKRIKILEEMAQRLYEEWFVKFKFPGREKVKMVDSPLGKIPEGWEVKKIEDQIKRIPSGKKYENKTVFKNGKVPVLDQGKTGIIGYHNDEPGVAASKKHPVIVFANHTCYQNLILYPFSTIQNVLPFLPKDKRSIYWLHWVTKDTISFHDYKGHWPEFIAKKILVPPVEITSNFGEIVKSYVDLNFELQKTNENLAKTRDLLIPQLVTGRRELKS